VIPAEALSALYDAADREHRRQKQIRAATTPTETAEEIIGWFMDAARLAKWEPKAA